MTLGTINLNEAKPLPSGECSGQALPDLIKRYETARGAEAKAPSKEKAETSESLEGP